MTCFLEARLFIITFFDCPYFSQYFPRNNTICNKSLFFSPDICVSETDNQPYLTAYIHFLNCVKIFISPCSADGNQLYHIPHLCYVRYNICKCQLLSEYL